MRTAVIAIVLCACGSNQDAELDGARTQVRRFFDAVAHSDCATLASLLPKAGEPGACEELVRDWREDMRVQLVDIPDVHRDGRDRKAIIVHTTVMRHDLQQTMLVRVTHEQGVWQLVL